MASCSPMTVGMEEAERIIPCPSRKSVLGARHQFLVLGFRGNNNDGRALVKPKRCPLHQQQCDGAAKPSTTCSSSCMSGNRVKDPDSSLLPKASIRRGGMSPGYSPISSTRLRILYRLPRVTIVLVCFAARTVGLVVEEPFRENFEHAPAAFGPSVFSVNPPIESRPLVKARPRDACTPLYNSAQMEDGAIALVERGNCNFTQKVLNAQDAGASAVVVTDTEETEEWHTTMSGSPEDTKGIRIPSVFVSRETGEHLWNKRIRPLSGKIRASVNATGHIQPRPIGAVETLGIYILVSMLLIGFSGICGVLVALVVTWHQRGYRTRAMRKLKSFTFKRNGDRIPKSISGLNPGGGQSHGAAGKDNLKPAASAQATKRDDSGSDASTRKSPAGQVVAAGTSTQKPPSKGGVGGQAQRKDGEAGDGIRAEDDTCAICLDVYQDGDSLTALPCRHSFHTNCIRPWLSGMSGVCPMCKSEAFSPRGKFLASLAPRLEAAMAELTALCTDNLIILLFFFLSIACGVVAANISGRG